ncbi:MAG: hypothetical protein KA257_08250 [Opitutaceae bacterium]|nr:hypothetical protein [Opitutaceae bacterium]MBP9914291.1 hypothetical protein [Opitutaceae bacterium]
MSLINDALKRAQRQRTADAAGVTPPMPGGGSGVRIGKRGKPIASQSLLLIIVGATVLIVLSVVATVYLVRDNAKPAAPAAPATVATVTVPVSTSLGIKKSTATDSAPSIVLFVPSPLREDPAVATPSTVVPKADPAPVPPANILTVVPAPILAKPVTTTPVKPVPKTPVAPDERVYVFLDNLHVTGIRTSGDGSKVLMNDRVYRVNDIVDRGLGLRLTQVASDALTFTDERGAVYTKNL